MLDPNHYTNLLQPVIALAATISSSLPESPTVPARLISPMLVHYMESDRGLTKTKR